MQICRAIYSPVKQRERLRSALAWLGQKRERPGGQQKRAQQSTQSPAGPTMGKIGLAGAVAVAVAVPPHPAPTEMRRDKGENSWAAFASVQSSCRAGYIIAAPAARSTGSKWGPQPASQLGRAGPSRVRASKRESERDYYRHHHQLIEFSSSFLSISSVQSPSRAGLV